MLKENATLDINGSFYGSTANELRFSDGGVFSASNPGATVLTTAPPTAFGFLGGKPASISVDRSDLVVSEEAALSFVGGDITIRGEGGEVATIATDLDIELEDLRNFITAPSGAVTLVSVGAAGQVPIAGETDLNSFAELGRVRTDDLFINISGNDVDQTPGGSVRIEGGQIQLNNTWIISDSYGDGAGGDLVFRGNDISITADRGRSRSNSSTGVTGVLTRPTSIEADPWNDGRGGDIRFEATGNLIFHGGVGVFATPRSDGDGGNVILDAQDISIRFSSSIGAQTFGEGVGRAGDTTVQADTLFISGDGAVRFTGLFSISGGAPMSGDGGTLRIDVRDIELRNNAELQGITLTNGRGGDIVVNADSLRLLTGSRISPFTFGAQGRAGDIIINANNVLIDHQDAPGVTDIIAASFGDGDGGNVKVTAGNLDIRIGSIAAPTTAPMIAPPIIAISPKPWAI